MWFTLPVLVAAVFLFGKCKGWSNKRPARRSVRTAWLAALAFVVAGAAAAADNDWIVNINDLGSDPTPAGGTVVYNVTVTNAGFDPAPASSITLTIPANATMTGVTGGVSGCAPLPATGPASVTCTIPPLAASGSVPFTVQVTGALQGTISLTAAAATAGDSDTTNNSQSESTTIVAGSDFSLALTGPASAGSGSIVNYLFTATNNGPDIASAVTVQVPVPTGLSRIVTPPGCTLTGSLYTCTYAGPIAVGGTRTINFQGQLSAASSSTLAVVGSITGATPADPIVANNTAQLTTTLTAGSDLAITKARVPAGQLYVGDAVTFTLGASYTGDSPVGLTIQDSLPTYYTINSVTPSVGSGWSCNVVGQLVTCTKPGGSGAGAQVPLGTVTINATANAAASGTVTNTATISSTSPTDPIPANNVATDGGTTIVAPISDLAAIKQGPQPALLVLGQSGVFPISTRNLGNKPYAGTITMDDHIPAGMTVDSIVAHGWSCGPALPLAGPATLTCTRVYTPASPLAVGATTPTVDVSAHATVTGPLTNILDVNLPNDPPDANYPDPLKGNNTTQASVDVSPAGQSADVSILKTATPATVVAGDLETFTLEIRNAGPSAATNVAVSDALTGLINAAFGPGQGVESITTTAGTATPFTCTATPTGTFAQQMSCLIASVPVCTPGVDCPTVTVAIRPGGNAGTRTNTANAVSQGTADPDPTNNASIATYDVTARADVTVTKVASPSPVPAGQNLTYVLTATNLQNGLSAADNVTITDTLPSNVVFLSAVPASGSCGTAPAAGSVTSGANNQLVCNLGTLANGVQRTVIVTVRPTFVTSGTTLTNTADVTTTTPEVTTANNQATVATPVAAPITDLLVNKTDDVDPVAVSDLTTYTISATNLGPSAAENVDVTDTLPTGNLAFQSVTAPGATCTGVPAAGTIGGSFTCRYPTLLANQTVTIKVAMTGTAKGTANNVATIASDESRAGYDPIPGNDTEGETTTVRTRADVEVTSKTPSAATVDLRAPFTWDIVVTNNTGAGLAEADGIVLSDTLPASMVMTGPASVVAGTSTLSTCTGAAGAKSFTCQLGTMLSGDSVTVRVPVQVVSVGSYPQSFTNSATVTTTSRDMNPANNTNSGTVAVNSSTLSGNVFLDFANDGGISAGDLPLGGVPVTLSGTAFDGTPVTRTVNTLANGTYSFAFLPAGTYTVSRGATGQSHVTDGITTPGTSGGTSGATAISAITLAANTQATGYLFAVVPQARIGIAKAAGTPVVHPDASFDVTFQIRATNFSLEALNAVTIADRLDGAAPGFGAPGTAGALTPGQYAVTGVSGGTCGGANAGFDGSADDVLASGITLAAGASCQMSVTLKVQPVAPLPPVLPSGGRFENQATITGTGALSGQTQATNPQLVDLSDDGATPDANGNGLANEAGENDPTPVAPVYTPSIALVKAADVSAVSSPPVVGDVVTYRFTVTNTGNVTLANVTLTDPLTGLVLPAAPQIASLAPGASTTVTGTLALIQAQVDAGTITNQATVQGTDPLGTSVTDLSGTTVSDDTPLVTPLAAAPRIALVKTADSSAVQNPAQVGDPVTFHFTVTNVGNVTLTNVRVAEVTIPGLTVTGGPIASMLPGASDSATFSAVYHLTQADLDAGQVVNQAQATGTPPAGADVTDLSGATVTDDVPTTVLLAQGAQITLVKTADVSAFTAGAAVGDVVPYSFTITNTGNVTLTNISLTDVLPGVVVTTHGPGPLTLAPGASDTTFYTATYTLTAADVAAGQVVNTATTTGYYGPGNALAVAASDSETAVVLSIKAIPETFPPFTTDGGTTTSILGSDTLAAGSATLANVTITVLGTSHPGVTLDPLTGLITLAPGLPAGVYTVDYRICSIIVPTVCDTTTETVYQAPVARIETTKTQSVTDNGDGVTGVGDTVTYTITVANQSNAAISGLTLSDTFQTLDGASLTLTTPPAFVQSSAGSPQGTLAIGETVTYRATFVLTQFAVSHGGVSNQVTASGQTVVPPGVPVTPVPVSDLSDNGDDTDGNTVDDPTVLRVDPTLAPSGLTVTKTTPKGIVTRGAVVPYTITVANANPAVSGPLNIVDVLPPGFLYVPGSATLGGAPVNVTVAGRIVTWPNVMVPPQAQVVATLNARVTTSAPSGESTNSATVRNPATNTPMAPAATATVRILPEPVFDCGDVIGKVFDDVNRDGDQTPPPEGADKAIEPGLPGVRLAGVDGTIITTDRYGRFHVPCAMLPNRRGSSFILKLDTASLPAGYRLTTENPRVVRLTPGKMTEMNFGASIARVVRIDLDARAFALDESGRPVPSAALVEAMTARLQGLAGDEPVVRLVYHLTPDDAGTDANEAEARLRQVRAALTRAWAEVGRTKLTVEMLVVRS